MDIEAIGRQYGLSPQQTQAAFDALAPVIAAGMRRNAGSGGGGGLGDLLGALGGGGLSRYADDAQAYGQPQSVDDGNAILAQVFGSKDVSRGVAQQLSASTGLSDSILKKLLPMVAAFVMAQFAKKAFGGSGSGGGGLGDILGQVLGGGQPAPTQRAPQGGGGGGGLGDILGDLLGGGQRQSGGGSGGGLGDILGNVLGGGREEPAQPAPSRAPGSGGGLDDILGDILGGGGSRGGGTPMNVNAADDLLNAVERALRNR